MAHTSRSTIGTALERLSTSATRWAGSAPAFAIACLVVLLWVATGPVFGYSDTWQLVINTGTTIATFLMVFLLQRSQNKEALAMQLKLNELVAAMQGASNRLIDVEDLSEHELHVLRCHFNELARMAKSDAKLTESHSIEEARERHRRKSGGAA